MSPRPDVPGGVYQFECARSIKIGLGLLVALGIVVFRLLVTV